ncbi:glycosyltransferase [Corallincola holothuriorum]|uniref:Glycosyltransferase n=1 Tax=Corallincola holothuriorum TaxID=2282215 RepID=A0A368MZ75_9GAMM|nr:glycosyltransferase [Corallincola holothuriorum]RCU43296.1 glycosyltransferase [Corallincola holothuriorum]
MHVLKSCLKEIGIHVERNPVKVSICVITYNHEPYIRECLESLVSQKTDFNFEIIIRDDKSTDGTYPILKEFEENYPQLITVLKSDVNLGMNRNFRKVFSSSSGDYIALCEGDDFWLNEKKIQLQYELAKNNSEVNFFIHACHSVNSNSLKIKQNKRRFFGAEKELFFDCNDILSYPGQFAPTSSYFISSSEVKLLPSWFDDAPIGDVFIELYAARKTGGMYSPEILSAYRIESFGSWTDKMKRTAPKGKIAYSERMIIAIRRMQEDFPYNRKGIEKKINALNFFASLSYLRLGDKANFRKKIVPVDNTYISKYHNFLALVKDIPIAPQVVIRMYELVKKIQWYFNKR